MDQDLVHELKEANAEIARHHKAFEEISTLLNEWNQHGGVCGEYTLGVLRRIRNIVG